MLAQAIADMLLPLIHSIEIFGAEKCSYNFKVNHFLKANDVKLRQIVLWLTILLIAS